MRSYGSQVRGSFPLFGTRALTVRHVRVSATDAKTIAGDPGSCAISMAAPLLTILLLFVGRHYAYVADCA